MKNRWLLPEGISDLLPAEARDLEHLRRTLLDGYVRHGFELVLPPLVEYLDSLLTGQGGDLDLKTFKLVNRLCYCASVLRTRPTGLEGSREPIQIGAEIYGHAGIEADIEIIDLLLQSLEQAGLGALRLDICHLGLASLLLAELPGIDEDSVLELLQARDLPAPWGGCAARRHSSRGD